LLTLPIALLLVLDYFDLESFQYFNIKTYPQYSPTRFVFEETWKGRMFYLFFIWLFFIEFITNQDKILHKKPTRRSAIIISIACLLIPTIYIIVVNVVPGATTLILDIGQRLGINEPLDRESLLTFHWPLSFEYVIFWLSFTLATTLAYGLLGLKNFSISISLLGVITAAYMINTLYPSELSVHLLITFPTAALSAAVLSILGYTVYMNFPYVDLTRPGYPLPLLTIRSGIKSYSAAVDWPCAGVHSLLLYVLIIFVFFKRSELSSFRKAIYFICGFFGTYFVNVLRVASILIIGLNSGYQAAQFFHDTYGELYFLTWMMSYILLIICVERFMLAERFKRSFAKLYSALGTIRGKSKIT
jgi:exosortase/archaeosortase family protein